MHHCSVLANQNPIVQQPQPLRNEGEALGSRGLHPKLAAFAFWILGVQQPQGGNEWENCKEEYIKWATNETTAGRKERAIAISTANQVVGSVARVVQKLAENGAHSFLTNA